MKRIPLPVLLSFAMIWLVLGMSGVTSSSAQQNNPTPTITEFVTSTPPGPATASAGDLEDRVERLEIAQEETIHSLTSINEYNQFLFTLTGGIVALLVGIPPWTTRNLRVQSGCRIL